MGMNLDDFLTQRLCKLQNGILDYLDGNYGRDKYFKTKHDKCPHGLFGWEACENCIDDYFKQVLDESRSPAVSNGDHTEGE